MSLKTVFAQILAFFSGGHVGETLKTLSADAEADYDAALNRAHQLLADTKAELERLETLIVAARRRAIALTESGVLPTSHGARMDDVVEKVA